MSLELSTIVALAKYITFSWTKERKPHIN